MIVAGEASGDLHGGNLARAVGRLNPRMELFGIGGPRMRAAGVDIRMDISELAVMGLMEVLVHYRRLRGILRRVQRLLREERPDLLITVDYPGFNLRLARSAREMGIPVLHYISPQVWAWREHRVKQIARSVDMMAVLLPFEETFYRRHGIPVRFVGHPLVDEVRPSLERKTAQRRFGVDPDRHTVGLLPGSRPEELRRLTPLLLESAHLLRRYFPDLQLLLPLAPGLRPEALAPWLELKNGADSARPFLHHGLSRHAQRLPVTVVEGHGYDLMQCCDVIVTASGTATLEVALMEVPMVIVYKVSPLTYAIARRMVRLSHIGLVNIVAGTGIVPELLQHQARPEAVARAVACFLDSPEHARETRERLAEVRTRLGRSGGSENVARLALEMLDNRDRPASTIRGNES